MHSETANPDCLNPTLHTQRSYVKTISFSFCFLGTPPRDSELPVFCDLQFLNCSHGKLDLGTVERRGTIFSLVRGKRMISFLSGCSQPRVYGFSCTKVLRASEFTEMGTKCVTKMHINPKVRMQTTRMPYGMEVQAASQEWLPGKH